MAGELGESSARTSSAESSSPFSKKHQKKYKKKKLKELEEDEDEDVGEDDEESVSQIHANELGLIIKMFARFLHRHEANQKEMLRVGGVGLVAWAITRAADRGILKRCNDSGVST